MIEEKHNELIELSEYIERMLIKLGCQLLYKGFRFLHEAIILASEDNKRLYNVRASLFPIIAEKYNTNSNNIERDIRTLINSIDEQVFYEISFGKSKDTPTVVQFISYLTAYIKYQS